MSPWGPSCTCVSPGAVAPCVSHEAVWFMGAEARLPMAERSGQGLGVPAPTLPGGLWTRDQGTKDFAGHRLWGAEGGAALCPVGCSATPPTSTHWQPAAAPGHDSKMTLDIVKCPWGSKLPPPRTTAPDKAPDFSAPWLRPLSVRTLTLPRGAAWGLDIANAEQPGCREGSLGVR